MKNKGLLFVLSFCIMTFCGLLFGACGATEHYNIRFEENGGEEMTDLELLPGDDISLYASTNKDGYSFAGWYTTPDLTGDAYVLDKMPEKELILYAKWEAVTYTITYDLNMGDEAQVLPENAKTTYTIIDNGFALFQPTLEGFVFSGWTGTGIPSNNPTKNVEISNQFGNREYTAHWERSTCNISFSYNYEGGSVNYGNLVFDGPFYTIHYNTSIYTTGQNDTILNIRFPEETDAQARIITATPNDSYVVTWQIKQANETEYQNFSSVKVKGNVNIRALFTRG